MKNLLTLIFAFFITISVVGQTKYYTKSGSINFEASVSNFEPVAAKNNTVSAILKDDGTFASLALIRGFQFKKALMQEHFNEKRFMDSETFPKAKFNGNVEGFNLSDLSSEDKEYNIKGNLSIHGVTKEITTTAKLKSVDGKIYLSSKFSVNIADYDIALKSKVSEKIAKTVNVDINFELNKK